MPQNEGTTYQTPLFLYYCLKRRKQKNHIKNTAYLNAIIPILENTVPTLPSERDILHTLIDREQELAKHSDKRSLTALSSGTLT